MSVKAVTPLFTYHIFAYIIKIKFYGLREVKFMAYFTDEDSTALAEGNSLLLQERYQEALSLYREELEDCIKKSDYSTFSRYLQSLADCYYLCKDFNSASQCYFAIIAYNIWQYPDIMYDYIMKDSKFLNFMFCWGSHLGYTLYGWDDEYSEHISGKKIRQSFRIKDSCSDIGADYLLAIFKQLKEDSRAKRDDNDPRCESMSRREYYSFNKDIITKAGKELFKHCVFEKLNFTKPSYFR